MLLAAGTMTAASAAPKPALLSPLAKSWLNAQTNIQTWSADFVQTRTLKSLTQPLTANGHVWFAAPDRFRWELGRPPETVAVRGATNLLILYPRLKRVEIIPLEGQQTGRWRDVLSMLDAGFPRNETELLDRYQVLSQTVTNRVCQLRLQPRSAAARQMMPEIEIDFDTKDLMLSGTELQFADGSTMRNDFHDIVLNPKLNADLFSPPIPSDYTVVHPLANR